MFILLSLRLRNHWHNIWKRFFLLVNDLILLFEDDTPRENLFTLVCIYLYDAVRIKILKWCVKYNSDYFWSTRWIVFHRYDCLYCFIVDWWNWMQLVFGTKNIGSIEWYSRGGPWFVTWCLFFGAEWKPPLIFIGGLSSIQSLLFGAYSSWGFRIDGLGPVQNLVTLDVFFHPGKVYHEHTSFFMQSGNDIGL